MNMLVYKVLFFNTFFYCRLAEQNTDAILDNPNKDAGRTHQSAEEVDATVNKCKEIFLM